MKKQIIKTTAFTLLLAAYLVYPGTLFAQDERSGKYRIKISTDENGKRTEIDTTFSSHEEMDAFLSEHDVNVHTSGAGHDSQVFVFHTKDGNEIPAELKAELEKAEKELRKAKKELKKAKKDLSDEDLEKLMEELEQIKIEVETELGEDGEERTEIIIGGTKDSNDNVMIWNHDDKESSEKIHRHIIELEEEGNDGKVEKVIIIRTDDGPEEKIIQKKRVINNEGIKDSEVVPLSDEEQAPEDAVSNGSEPESYRIPDGNLKAYPNPSAGMVNLKYNPVNEKPVSIRIIDSRGRVIVDDMVASSGAINKSYDLQSNSKGTYLLQIRQGKYWMHEKIVLK